MKDQFEEQMSKRTDDELNKIINSPSGDYQPDAVKAAEQELKRRQNMREGFSKYSNEGLRDFLKSLHDNPSQAPEDIFSLSIAKEEARKRNLSFSSEKNKTDIVSERYPALRFIAGVYRLLAWLVLIAAIIIILYPLSQNGKIEIPFALAVIAIGGLLFVTLLATAEGISVFLDIEHNTRLTAMNSKK